MNNSPATVKALKSPSDKCWTAAISACIENGERLLYDAEGASNPSAFALAILAQEEFAKAYLLRLVDEGVIPICNEVLRACRDHTCKHLIGLLMKHLFTPIDDMAARNDRFKDGVDWRLPAHVADALNIFCHEKLAGFHSPYSWCWSNEPYDKKAKGIAKGSLDALKQNALYVGIGKNGVTSIPACNPAELHEAVETAKMLEEVARGGDVWAYTEKANITDILKVMVGQTVGTPHSRGAKGSR